MEDLTREVFECKFGGLKISCIKFPFSFYLQFGEKSGGNCVKSLILDFPRTYFTGIKYLFNLGLSGSPIKKPPF